MNLWNGVDGAQDVHTERDTGIQRWFLAFIVLPNRKCDALAMSHLIMNLRLIVQ